MEIQKLSIAGIPAVLWGAATGNLFIAVHGDQSNKADDVIKLFAEEAVPKGYQVLSFDLPEHGERKAEARLCKVQNCVEDLGAIIKYAQSISDHIHLFACSMGAYFSMLAYQDEPIKQALLLSPVVDMKRLIQNMMTWFDVSEERLKAKQEVATPVKTRYWDYYQYVLEHPVVWDKPTALLYGAHDELCEFSVLSDFAERFKLDKSVLTSDELTDMIAALKGIGSVSEKPNIERVLDKLHANTDAVVSLREPIIIDLASHGGGQLAEKIELIKRAALQGQIIEFDYFYGKGQSRRRIEPYFVIFQWAAWYVFGFCLERSDFRLFKLQRLWGLHLSDERFVPREIPPEKRDFKAWFEEGKENKLVALFDPSEKHRLIDTYGFHFFEETDEGLRFEIGFSKREYILAWLLGFGGKVKVLEPDYIVEDLNAAAKNILLNYK